MEKKYFCVIPLILGVHIIVNNTGDRNIFINTITLASFPSLNPLSHLVLHLVLLSSFSYCSRSIPLRMTNDGELGFFIIVEVVEGALECSVLHEDTDQEQRADMQQWSWRVNWSSSSSLRWSRAFWSVLFFMKTLTMNKELTCSSDPEG